MLIFRHIDYEQDLEQVLELIQNNLDPNFTMDFFRWKHMDNPFGKSYGLLATENTKVIGLRMFMYWEFSTDKPNSSIRAIRPVDTVVDKAYRGLGLFKKLTLEGLEICAGQYDIIFNTPNHNSLPGYFKMGWKELEHTYYFKLGLINPFLGYRKFKNLTIEEVKINSRHLYYETLKTEEFIKWRYKYIEYKIAAFEGNYIIYKKNKMKGISSLIIFEILGDPMLYSIMLTSLAIKTKSPFIYYYANKEFASVRFIKTFPRKRAQIVFKEDSKQIHTNLTFSLGDLEGKL